MTPTRAVLAPALLSSCVLGPILVAGPTEAAVDNHIAHVSVASPETTGNGSFTQGISDNGRFVVFASHQPNLVPGDPGDDGRYIYLRDLSSGTTTRLSDGPDGYLMGSAVISGTGRYVVYPSRESSAGASALRLYDAKSDKTRVISPPAPAGTLDSEWFNAAISDNGKTVVYTRTSSTDDVTWVTRLYRYDVVARTTNTLVAGNLGGPPDQPNYATVPALSANGRYVAYAEARTPDQEVSVYDLVRRDLTTGDRLLLGTSVPRPLPSDAFGTPSISNSGRFITSSEGGVAGYSHVYLHNVTQGTTTLVSHDALGAPVEASAYQAQVSGDGRYVAFVSKGSEFEPTSPGAYTVVVWNRATDTIEAIVRNRQGTYPASTGASSTMPYLDGDGSTVAFTSVAQNLVLGASSRLERVYAWQR